MTASIAPESVVEMIKARLSAAIIKVVDPWSPARRIPYPTKKDCIELSYGCLCRRNSRAKNKPCPRREEAWHMEVAEILFLSRGVWDQQVLHLALNRTTALRVANGGLTELKEDEDEEAGRRPGPGPGQDPAHASRLSPVSCVSSSGADASGHKIENPLAAVWESSIQIWIRKTAASLAYPAHVAHVESLPLKQTLVSPSFGGSLTTSS